MRWGSEVDLRSANTTDVQLKLFRAFTQSQNVSKLYALMIDEKNAYEGIL